jgi:nucleoside phosphorylase
LIEDSDEPLPFNKYKSIITNDSELIISINGKDRRTGVDNVATQPATLNTFHLIDKFNVDIIINAGTAGAFIELGANIGDVILGYPHVFFHDRRIPLPGFSEYGVGLYPMPDVRKIATELGIRTGNISTGNSLDYIESDIEVMHKYRGIAKDMEAAAIAWVCSLFSKPILVLKAVTDFIDEPAKTPEQFTQNLDMTSKRLGDKTKELVSLISDYPQYIEALK